MSVRRTISSAVREHFRGWLIITVAFTVTYYVSLLGAMIYRFGNWPNYVTAYNWFGNVAEIIRATPSVQDMLPIIRDEWLLEVGYMNMDYGHGISEWSLNLIPVKMVLIVLLGAMIATVWALYVEQRHVCASPSLSAGVAFSSAGTGLVALTGATMSWVVCCATPSWIVGLAMLGMGVSTANWLEPAGTWLGAAGFVLLALGIVWQARGSAKAQSGNVSAADRSIVANLAAMEVGPR